jgi:hypothetical protein
MTKSDWTECTFCHSHIEPGEGELQKQFDTDKEKKPFHYYCFNRWTGNKPFEYIGPDDHE